jgi:hypothetical protein
MAGFIMKIALLYSLLQILGCSTSDVHETIDETEKKLITRIGDWDAFDQILQSIEEKTDQDLVLLHLSVDYPNHAKKFCKRVTLSSTKNTCKRILENPHLNMPK